VQESETGLFSHLFIATRRAGGPAQP
jgi:hypothetical protein